MHPDTSLYHREPALDIDISNELFSVKVIIVDNWVCWEISDINLIFCTI